MKGMNLYINRYGVVDFDRNSFKAYFDLDLIPCNGQVEGACFFHDASHDRFSRPTVNRRLERLLAKQVLELVIADVSREQLHKQKTGQTPQQEGRETF